MEYNSNMLNPNPKTAPPPTPAPAPTPAPTRAPTPAPTKHYLDKYSPTCNDMFVE